MSKFFETLGAIAVGTVVAVGSALNTGAEIVSNAATDAGKIVSNVAEGIAKAGEDKSSNSSKGNR